MIQKRNILFDGRSKYGEYKVVDMTYNGRPARMLYGEKNSPQSGVAKDDDPELLFDYNQRFMEIIMSQQPSKLLVIGGGAFMLPIAAHERFSSVMVDVVEIDELLVELSQEYFGLPMNDKRLRVYVADGMQLLAKSSKRYDMIVVDVFSGYSVPYQFLDAHAIMQYKKHLSKRGTIAINFISEYSQHHVTFATEVLVAFSNVFPDVALYQADASYPRYKEQNLLLVASNASAEFDYLQSKRLDV